MESRGDPHVTQRESRPWRCTSGSATAQLPCYWIRAFERSVRSSSQCSGLDVVLLCELEGRWFCRCVKDCKIEVRIRILRLECDRSLELDLRFVPLLLLAQADAEIVVRNGIRFVEGDRLVQRANRLVELALPTVSDSEIGISIGIIAIDSDCLLERYLCIRQLSALDLHHAEIGKHKVVIRNPLDESLINLFGIRVVLAFKKAFGLLDELANLFGQQFGLRRLLKHPFGCYLVRRVLLGCVFLGRVVRGYLLLGCVLLGCVLLGYVLLGYVLLGYVLLGCVLLGYVLLGYVLLGYVLLGYVLLDYVLLGYVLLGRVLLGYVLLWRVLLANGDGYFKTLIVGFRNQRGRLLESGALIRSQLNNRSSEDSELLQDKLGLDVKCYDLLFDQFSCFVTFCLLLDLTQYDSAKQLVLHGKLSLIARVHLQLGKLGGGFVKLFAQLT